MQSSKKATTRTSGFEEIEGRPLALGRSLAPQADQNRLRSKRSTLLAALAAACLFVAGNAQEPPAVRPDVVGEFMRAKLRHSQDVLEGLTLEDFDKIARGAQELSLASQASSWQVLQTEDYARQSAEFRRSCDSLRNAAKAGNLDGAALAWMEVTMKCVQCHKYVRGQQ
jgi:hypothetical protein